METPLKSRKNQGLTAAIVIPLCLLLSLLPSTLANSQTLQGRPSLLHLGLSAVFALIQIQILLAVRPRMLRKEATPTRNRLMHNGSRILIVCTIFLLSALIAMGIDAVLPADAASNTSITLTAAPPTRISGTAVYLLAALCFAITIGYQEEMLYRGYINEAFSQEGTKSRTLAILLSSGLFALGHLYQGIGSFFASFCASVLLCRLRGKGWSLHHLALGHMAWNVLVLVGRV